MGRSRTWGGYPRHRQPLLPTPPVRARTEQHLAELVGRESRRGQRGRGRVGTKTAEEQGERAQPGLWETAASIASWAATWRTTHAGRLPPARGDPAQAPAPAASVADVRHG